MLDKKVGWLFVLASIVIMVLIYWIGPKESITVLLVGLTPPVMMVLYKGLKHRKLKSQNE
ncbi:hypothetical protein CEH05_08075 [Halobacillus halophilus]|uniref:hypothetical protein n=1 Tax=Halobacillus halophilus TaxID=1570 RepID=UPI00030FE240|nr:hypothetical protein [Halobacillus halophilus]ASF39072.1 hypothetical protein CEH05_08075 [Halobacillus halophilus]